jgi:hypothetical protein
MKSLGVIYAPFQIAELNGNELHFEIEKNEGIVVVLPVKRFPNSMDSPLDYRSRQMMVNAVYPNVTVLPLPDEKYGSVFVQKLEALVSSIVNPTPRNITLYSDLLTIARYVLNNGKWETATAFDDRTGQSMNKNPTIDLLNEKECRRRVLSGPQTASIFAVVSSMAPISAFRFLG